MARRSILNRSFSTREKVLILVLVALLLVACYYFLVVKNVADTKAENDLQLQEITYTVAGYNEALGIVQSLQNGTYRCDVTDFSLTGKMLADGSIESVSATLDVTYYETTKGATNLSGLVDKSAS